MPDDERAVFNLGWHHMRNGRLGQGMRNLATGRFGGVFGGKRIEAGTQIWRGEPLLNSTVLFAGEGGFGDQIVNVRFARFFKEAGAKIVISCSRALFRLFRSLRYDAIMSIDSANGVDHDYWVPAMSAPLVLGLEYDTISGKPYIPKPRGAPLPGKCRIGLRWSGNPTFEHEQHRLFPRELMFNLRGNDATFYSLQRDRDTYDLPRHIHDLASMMGDWLDTARLVAGLDLVISSCTSVAHLSAAMGVPTWIVVPVLPYYLWALPGDRSPWYDTVRLFRQERYGDWSSPFEKLQDALNDYCKSAVAAG